MERLTEKAFVVPEGQWKVLNDEEYKKYKYVVDRPKYADLYSRLGMIENLLCGDKREYSIDRLRELIEADREGRCTIFPCRDWLDLVFGEQEVFYGIDTDYIENPIREITVHNEERFIWYDGWKNLVFCGVDENGLDWEFSPEEVGKTVFLTEEQAESALKAMKEREDDDRA